MRKSWTDERLDDFRVGVDRRFDDVDRRFDEVDRRFDEVNQRVDRGFDKCEIEFHRINDRLDDMHRAMVYGLVAMIAAVMGGYAATIGLVISQT